MWNMMVIHHLIILKENGGGSCQMWVFLHIKPRYLANQVCAVEKLMKKTRICRVILGIELGMSLNDTQLKPTREVCKQGT